MSHVCFSYPHELFSSCPDQLFSLEPESRVLLSNESSWAVHIFTVIILQMMQHLFVNLQGLFWYNKFRMTGKNNN